MCRVRSSSSTAVASSSSPANAPLTSSPTKGKRCAKLTMATGLTFRADGTIATIALAISAPGGGASLDRGELLLQRLDVLFVHAHGLPQPREAPAILLGVRTLLGQRRRRAIRVERTRFGQELLFGGEFVRKDLATHVVAALLRIGVDARKARGRGGLRRTDR